MVRNFERSSVERLRWQLLVAVSGVTVGLASCAGRSEKTNDHGGSAASGGSGALGGSSAVGGKGGSGNSNQGGTGHLGGGTGGTGARGGSGAFGGSGADGGSGGSAGGPIAGMGGSPIAGMGGSTNGGAGNVKPHGCVELDASLNDVPICQGIFTHRPGVTCSMSPHPTPPATAGAGGEGGETTTAPPPDRPVFGNCATDADCTEQPNGYCVHEDYGQAIQVICIYSCGPTTCADGEVCSCESGYVSEVDGSALDLNVCRAATCAADSECGPGSLCIAPLQAPCGPALPSAYHCQTPLDECGGPGDCPPAKSQCMYRSDHFVCEGAPACGRPFLVEGALRRGALIRDASWLQGSIAPSAPVNLPVHERELVAAHFAQAGLMEHASVAAFARFALQLLALGAPPELLEGATQAMTDETRHAKLCFALASRYAGEPVGPGPLDMTGALERVELLSVVSLVVEEGCIGETAAALEAAWSAAAAEDPTVREALAGIAEDEARHAELAWRFIAWAATRDTRVTPLVEARLLQALERCEQQPSASELEENPRLAAHGLLSEQARREARRTALREVLPGVVARLAA